METCLFTKHFQELDPDALGRTFRELGVDGADLTVRPKGNIDPAAVQEDLPRFADTLGVHGIKVSMLSTGITDAADPDSVKIIETAGRLGIKYIKLGYWQYPGFGHLREQEAVVRKALKELEPVLKANGVTAGFHTHSWLFMGINGANALRLVEECDPAVIGIYYDTGHEALEGALRGWEMDLDLCMDRIVMVAVKNTGLYPQDDADERLNGWGWKTVPLDEGLANIKAMAGYLRQSGYDGLYSLHSEYQGPFSFKDMNTAEVIEQTRRDLAWFRGLFRT